MGKIKINNRKNFTMVSNHVLKNQNLSLKAKGLYAYMWSLPEDWDYSVAGLTKVLKEGKSAINEALKELENEGYLIRTILRKGGKFSDMDYILNETPPPFTDFPSAEKPQAENQQQYNTIITNKEINNPIPIDKSIDIGGKARKKSYKDIFDDSKYANVKDALVLFVRTMRERNYTPRVNTVSEWAEKLLDYGRNNPTLAMRVVKQSIDKNWKSIYPLKSEAVSVKWDPELNPLAKDENGDPVVF